MKQRQVLRKFIRKTIVGTTETIVNERIEKELLTQDDLEALQEFPDDDTESAFRTYGIMTDWDGEIVGITLDTLVEGLTDYLKDDEDGDYKMLAAILKKIEPFRVYDLDFESEGLATIEDSRKTTANPSEEVKP